MAATAVLVAARRALTDLDEKDWTVEAIEAALRTAVVEGLGVKPRVAFTPLRVAVSGRRVSPPLFESMQILGRAACLERIEALAVRLEAGEEAG